MNIENFQNCSIDGSVIKQVDRFKYLCTYLARDGSLKLEFEERLKRAHKAVAMLKIFGNIVTFQYILKSKFIRYSNG